MFAVKKPKIEGADGNDGPNDDVAATGNATNAPAVNDNIAAYVTHLVGTAQQSTFVQSGVGNVQQPVAPTTPVVTTSATAPMVYETTTSAVPAVTTTTATTTDATPAETGGLSSITASTSTSTSGNNNNSGGAFVNPGKMESVDGGPPGKLGNQWRGAVKIDGNLRTKELMGVGLGKDWDKKTKQEMQQKVTGEVDKLMDKISDNGISPQETSDLVQKFFDDFGTTAPNVKNKISEFVTAKALCSAPQGSQLAVLPGPPALTDGELSPDFLAENRNDLIGDNVRISGIVLQDPKTKTLYNVASIPDNPSGKLQEKIDGIIQSIFSSVTSKVATYLPVLRGGGKDGGSVKLADGQYMTNGKVFVTLDLTECPWITEGRYLEIIKEYLSSLDKNILMYLDAVYFIIGGSVAFTWKPPG